MPQLKLSRGEICVANFIPLANGASLGEWVSAMYEHQQEINKQWYNCRG